MAAASELSRRTALLNMNSSTLRPSRICICHAQRFNVQQRRTAMEWLTGKRKKAIDPLTEDFLRRQRERAEKPAAASETPPVMPEPGDLGTSSVFSEDLTGPNVPPVQHETDLSNEGRIKRVPPLAGNPLTQKDVLDPNPRQRIAQERRYIVRSIKNRYRIDEKTRLARLERVHDCKSNEIKGSVRKLMPLARQIINKPIDEAILQMRWSKKGAAQEFLKHLIYARDQATVVKGMGLPNDKTKVSKRIWDRDNKSHFVGDTSRIYVDEAWLNKREQEFASDHRARGRVFRLERPFTTLTLRLKEEATRIRLDKERDDKMMKKKPWVQLPEKTIPYQRQIPLW